MAHYNRAGALGYAAYFHDKVCHDARGTRAGGRCSGRRYDCRSTRAALDDVGANLDECEAVRDAWSAQLADINDTFGTQRDEWIGSLREPRR